MDRSAYSNGFVRVDVTAWLFAKEFFDLVLHFRHAGHTANHDHVVDVTHRHARIFDGGAARCDGAFDQLFNELFELGAVEFDVQVLRT